MFVLTIIVGLREQNEPRPGDSSPPGRARSEPDVEDEDEESTEFQK